MYTDRENRTNAEGAIGMSNVAIQLVTKSYLKDIIDANSKVGIEVRKLKDYKTPSILIFFDDVTEQEKQDAELLLAGVNVVKRLYDAPHNGDGFDAWLKANLDPALNEFRQ